VTDGEWLCLGNTELHLGSLTPRGSFYSFDPTTRSLYAKWRGNIFQLMTDSKLPTAIRLGYAVWSGVIPDNVLRRFMLKLTDYVSYHVPGDFFKYVASAAARFIDGKLSDAELLEVRFAVMYLVEGSSWKSSRSESAYRAAQLFIESVGFPVHRATNNAIAAYITYCCELDGDTTARKIESEHEAYSICLATLHNLIRAETQAAKPASPKPRTRIYDASASIDAVYANRSEFFC